MMMIAAAIGAAAPDIKAAMSLTQPQVGLLSGSFFVAGGLAMPFAGRLVDRFGPTACMLAGILAAASGAAVFMASETLGLAVAGYGIMGASFAFGPPAYGALAARTLSTRAFPLGLAALALCNGASAAFGAVVGQAMPDDGGWRRSLVVLLALTPALVTGVWAIRRRVRDACARAVPSSGVGGQVSILRVLAVPEVRVCCVAAFALGGTLLSFGALWNEFLARTLWHADDAERATVTTAFRIAAALGAPAIALASLRTGPVPLLRIATGLTFVGIAAWALSPVSLGVPASVVVVTVLGLCAASLPVAVAAAVRSAPGQSAGTCVGVVHACGLLGGFALMWVPSLLVLVRGSTAAERGQVGGAAVALLVGVAHVLTWRLRRA